MIETHSAHLEDTFSNCLTSIYRMFHLYEYEVLMPSSYTIVHILDWTLGSFEGSEELETIPSRKSQNLL